MKPLPILAAAALITAAGIIGCDDKTSRSSTEAKPTDTAVARTDTDQASPSNTAAPGINPGSANGAGPNLGTTATNNPPANDNSANTNLSRGSTAVSSAGAPGDLSNNTGTTLNPHRIEDNAQPAAAQSTNMEPQQFVNEAASGGLFEVQSSQLALKKSSDQAVKDFAQQMINDHQKANDQLKTLAKDENLTVSDQLLPKHQQLLDRLNNASNDFDKQYDQIQKQAHEETVSLFQIASKNLSDAQLKSFASQTLPTLEQHLQHVNQLPQ